MNMIIKQVENNDIERVCEILKSVVIDMNFTGLTQWNDNYPTRVILQKDIIQKELFGAYNDDILVGFVALNTHQSKEYKKVPFEYDEPCLVVHRLQVDPEFHGQHIGFDLMIFAEKLAKEKGCKSIRLDTRFDNIPAMNLYKKLNYVRRGHVHFPRMPEFEFPCFEKEIL